MKNVPIVVFIATIMASAFVGACTGSVMAPAPVHAQTYDQLTPADPPYMPLHHNIPATFVGAPTGPIIYLCATQPRAYIGASGPGMEEDHYLQYIPCPLIPIK